MNDIPIILSVDERIKFEKWLRWNSYVSSQLAEQMQNINVPESVYKKEIIRSKVYLSVATELSRTEGSYIK